MSKPIIHLHRIGGGGSGTGYIGVFTNYTDLITQFPTAPTLSLAYVQNSQGTPWLPGGIGGTFYSKGTYLFDGVNWVDGLGEVAEELDDILNTMNTQDLASVLSQGNIANLNILMRLNEIRFGATDDILIKDDSGVLCMVTDSAFGGYKMQMINGTNVSDFILNFAQAVYQNQSAVDNGKIILEYAANSPSIKLKLGFASGGFENELAAGNPTANRVHTLQDRNGTLAHTDQIGLGALKTKSGIVPIGSFALSGGNLRATVNFATPFVDPNYSISLIETTNANRRVNMKVDSAPTAAGFTISLGTNNPNNIVDIRYIAIKNGGN